MKRRWDAQTILRQLKQLHRAGANLSYNAMQRTQQPLLSAAAYHFGSYPRAIGRAGLDYAEITRRPRWTKVRIIRLIKRGYRKGAELNWAAVTARDDELGRSAFAARRLFGSWARALHAAGLHDEDIACYRRWDRSSVVAELKQRRADGEPLNSGALQRDDPGCHAAAIRLFGSYDAALRAARVDPGKVRLRG